MKSIFFVFMTLLLNTVIAQINLTNGLVGYFAFDGNADDSSSLHLNGNVYNAQLTTDVIGNQDHAYFFNGYNAHIDFGNSARNITNVVSVSAWFKTATTDWRDWITGRYNWMQDGGIQVIVDQGKAALAGRNGTNQWLFLDSNVYVNDGKWHHILAVINDNTWELWVDCNLTATLTSISNPQITPPATLSVGYYPLGYNGDHLYFPGTIDEVRWYNRTLTTDEKNFLCRVDNIGEIDMTTFQDSYQLSPNPANQKVTVKYDNQTNNLVELKIYNLTGQLLLKKKFNKTTDIDVSRFQKGVYMLVVSDDKKSFSKKLIIK